MKKILPSILSADFANLERDIKELESIGVDMFHIDVMDGNFVPNISFGFPIIGSIRPKTDKVFDCHLMVVDPERYVTAYAQAGADIVTIHVEATKHIHGAIQKIKAAGMKAGVVINPGTPVEALIPVLALVDQVLIMTVNPGFGGQKFIESSIKKVQRLRQLIDREGSKALIEVDGGVQAETAPRLVEAGVDILVSGSYVFKAADPKATIHSLKQLHR